jgi:GNAT superfamily N-acetyltransferase
MTVSAEPVLRVAEHDDVEAICRFGVAYVRPHYAPLIGAAVADGQVRSWWNEPDVQAVVARGLVVVAEADEDLVGVGQRGRRDSDHVIHKLYVHPRHRGRGLGPRLLDALSAQLPADADRLYIEHFVGNERAGAFYEREGFTAESIEPGPADNPAVGVVWRVRPLSGYATAPGRA